MKNSSSHRLRNYGTKSSPRRSSQPAGYGFSRPAPAKGNRGRPKSSAGRCPEPFAPSRDWLSKELHALAIDDDRARSYLAKPGCNVVLGTAQRARVLFKRFCILSLVRE